MSSIACFLSSSVNLGFGGGLGASSPEIPPSELAMVECCGQKCVFVGESSNFVAIILYLDTKLEHTYYTLLECKLKNELETN